MAKYHLFLYFVVLSATSGSAQSTFVYDQQSSTFETPDPGAGPTIQAFASVGQSFTPNLPAVDFIRLKFSDKFPTNGLGATLLVNLLSGPTNGVLLSSTAPVLLPDGFTGTVDLLLPTRVSLTPGGIYYFEPIVQSGDQWLIDAGEYNYAGGSDFFNGVQGGSDFWFREGIIIPEPSASALLVAGLGVIAYLKRRPRPV